MRKGYGNWKCHECETIFRTRRELIAHGKKIHGHGSKGWNKGLTRDTSRIISKISQTRKDLLGKGLLIHPFKGKRLSEEHRRKISESMAKAHKDGRAHNIVSCRWNNEPSYPEKFFMHVIDINFNDKNYRREYPFERFSLDFAWVSKKRCIEIDGDQHQRFEDIKERDSKKDEALTRNGWSILRIRWKDMFDNPKFWIQKAKEFIDS